MIRIFERLVQKEIDSKQKHLRLFAWLLLITYVVSTIQIIRAVIKIWNRHNLLKKVKEVLKKDTEKNENTEPVGI
jgi:hypothetical protein